MVREYIEEIPVQSEREDIKSIHFSKKMRMTIVFTDGHYCEYIYQLKKTVYPKIKKE